MSIDAALGIPEFHAGDRVRKVREQLGLTIAELAEELGIGRGTLTNYERGYTQPKKLFLRALAVRAGVPLEWLETGIAPQPKPGGDGDGVRPKRFELPTF